jgi:hypothetical protein
VKDDVASRNGFFQRGRRAQVASDTIGFESLDVSQVAGLANQQPQICALLGQRARHVRAQKSCSASNESSQRLFSITRISVATSQFSVKAEPSLNEENTPPKNDELNTSAADLRMGG